MMVNNVYRHSNDSNIIWRIPRQYLWNKYLENIRNSFLEEQILSKLVFEIVYLTCFHKIILDKAY